MAHAEDPEIRSEEPEIISPDEDQGEKNKHKKADAEVIWRKLRQRYTGIWGAKVFWLAIFTLGPFILQMKSYHFGVNVSFSTAVYAAYHGLGIYIYAWVFQLEKKKELFPPAEHLAKVEKLVKMDRVVKPLGWSVVALLVLTFAVNATFTFGPLKGQFPLPKAAAYLLGIPYDDESEGRELISSLSDLQKALAPSLGGEARTLHLNLPPERGWMPGSIFVIDDRRRIISNFNSDKGELVATPPTVRVPVDSNILREVGLQTLWRTVGSLDGISIELQVDDIEVVTVGTGTLRRLAMDSPTARRRADSGRPTHLVSRAFRAQMSFHLHRPASIEERDWLVLHRTLSRRGVDLEIATDDVLIWQASEPTVIAFEAVTAEYVVTHLGESLESDQIKLEPLLTYDIRAKADESHETEEAQPWVLALASSGYYPQAQRLNQPWNRESANEVYNALSPWQPRVERFDSSQESPMTRESLREFVQQISQTAADNGAKMAVFYIISHTVLDTNQQPMILMSDFQRAGSDTDGGMLPLRTLYQWLDEELDIPFAVLVDGCMENERFAEQLQEFGLHIDRQTRQILYLGDAPMITDEMSRMAQMQLDFAPRGSFLRSENPVVLGAKPGTLAFAEAHPRLTFGSVVGPIAANLSRAAVNNEDEPISEIILQNTFTGLGEINALGAMSWSDFSTFRRASRQLLHRSDSETVSDDAVETISAPVDAYLQGLFVGEDAENIWFNADWALARWNAETGETSTIYEGERVFPVLVMDHGTYLVRMNEFELTYLPEGDPEQSVVLLTEADVEYLFDLGGSLLAVEQGGDISVDDRLWIVEGTETQEIERFNITILDELTADRDGVLYYSRGGAPTIWKRDGQTEIRVTDGVQHIGPMLVIENTLFVVSRDGRYLYRVAEGATTRIVLDKILEEPLSWSGHGPANIQPWLDGRIALRDNRRILLLDPSLLPWE